MKEFDFIHALKAISGKRSPEGIGDDAAVLNGMLIAKDIMTGGVHFLPTEPVHNIVRRLFGSNVSDICAMGGESGGYYALLGISSDGTLDKGEFLKAVDKVCKEYNITLIGGDTTGSVSGIFLSVTIIGKAGKHILTRSGAKAGDRVYLSRAVGGSGFALEQRLGGAESGIFKDCTGPEIEIGAVLGSIGGVTACIDISDGLGKDLSHIAEASGVKIWIDGEKLPVVTLPMPRNEAVTYALGSGEEYCLAFTVSPEHEKMIQKAVSEKTGREIFCIGEVFQGSGAYIGSNGSVTDISGIGYEHKI